MRFSTGYQRQEIISRRSAGDSSGSPGGVGGQGLPDGGEGAEELSRQSGEVLNDQVEGPGGRPLQLMGRHGSDGGAPPALVTYPVQGVKGRVSAISTQAEKVDNGC